MMNHKFGTHLMSGNGRGHQKVVDRHSEKQERTRNLKFAIFCLTVGVLLFLADQFAKQPQADGQPNALSNVGLDLSVSHKSEPTGTRNDPAEGATYPVRFRLTNRGNQSVFYPVDPGTSRPIGRLVYRVGPDSQWVVLSSPKEPTSSAPPSVGGKVAWVEMPPGGWADGIYDDPGPPGADHAYEIDLKLATNGNIIRFFSQAYRVDAN